MKCKNCKYSDYCKELESGELTWFGVLWIYGAVGIPAIFYIVLPFMMS